MAIFFVIARGVSGYSIIGLVLSNKSIDVVTGLHFIDLGWDVNRLVFEPDLIGGRYF